MIKKSVPTLLYPSRLVLFTKRTLDIFIGFAGTVIFVVTYPFIALLICLESKGPAIYSQTRVGGNMRIRRTRTNSESLTLTTNINTTTSSNISSNTSNNSVTDTVNPSATNATSNVTSNSRRSDYGGKPFVIYKYRTMRTDAEAAGPQLCIKGLDPRVTSIGKWLRALHLDELPQFWNILKGDMSFIGPRPERPHFTEQYLKTVPHYPQRTLLVRPGLTGLAQIILGYDDSMDSVIRKTYFDLSYSAALSTFGSWLKIESWIFLNTFIYLGKKTSFEGETRKLDGLSRAKQLPFIAKALKKANTSATSGLIRITGSSGTNVVNCSTTMALGNYLDGLKGQPRQAIEVSLNPGTEFDLNDFGFLVQMIHKVRDLDGKITIRNPNAQIQKMLKEVHLDKVVELSRVRKVISNFMTIDVECWFHAYNLKEQVPKCNWHLQESRVKRNVTRILDLLKAHEVKATFFVLGWVADHFPEVVSMIDQEGHEIGTHGYYHNLITEMTPDEFEADLDKSLNAISRHTRQKIIGHRGSNFTITSSTLWALDILPRYGIEYDSSIFPIGRSRYGIPNYPNRLPHQIRLQNGKTIKEFPMSTFALGRKMLPISGGGYLRLYPYRVTDRYIEQMNAKGLPSMVYFHPWELDTEQKRLAVSPMKRFQHYVNLNTTEWKLSLLMERFKFSSIREAMSERRIQQMLLREPVQLQASNPVLQIPSNKLGEIIPQESEKVLA